MPPDDVLLTAQFNRNVRTYWLLSGAVALTITVVGILLLPIWFIAGMAFTELYLKRMSCTLTRRSLKVNKGVLVRTEKTIPLDKITDLGVVQGPIMRLFDIESLSIETAGQSGQGSLVSLTGIIEGRKFRDAVLAQRDKVVADAEVSPTAGREFSGGVARLEAGPAGDLREILIEIRDSLSTIADRLAKRDGI
jgi:putative membrane protein